MRRRTLLLTGVAVALFAAGIVGRGTEPALAAGGPMPATPETSNDTGLHTSLELNAGNPLISYYDATQGNLKLSICDNGDCSAGLLNVLLDSAGDVGRYSSLELDSAGNPVVAYYDATNGNLKVIHCDNSDCTAGWSTESIDTTDDDGLYASLALNSSGLPVISHYDATEANLHMTRCTDADCAGAVAVTTVNSVPDDGLHTSLALDGSDNPAISYYDATNGALNILRCDDPACALLGENTVTPESSGAGLYTSIALNASGSPVVSFYDAMGGDVELTICNNIDCSASWVNIHPDSAGDVGLYTSVALDSSDRPVMSYYDATKGKLKLLRCNSADCTAGWTISSPDGYDDVGRYTSIALDAFGIPAISYYDATSGDVKVVHCVTLDCDSDFDDDRCPDWAERLTFAGSEGLGGRRSPKNPNDYFNPSHDGQNRTDDILLVVAQYFKDDNDGNPGLPPYANPLYNPDTDRTMGGPNSWNLGPPNGLQRIDDILASVKQYFHDCI